MLAFCFLWISSSSWFEAIWKARLWPVGLGWLLGSSLLHSQLLQPLAPHPKSHRGTGNRGLWSICNGVTWLPLSPCSPPLLCHGPLHEPLGQSPAAPPPSDLDVCRTASCTFFLKSPRALCPSLTGFPWGTTSGADGCSCGLERGGSWPLLPATGQPRPLLMAPRLCPTPLVGCAWAKSHHCKLLWHKRIFNKVCDLFWGHTYGFPGALALI